MLKQAVVLVGGFGTGVDKPIGSLRDVAGRPFLEYLLDDLSRYPSIESIVLLAGHLADETLDRYEGCRWRKASVSVVSDPAPLLGDGTALKRAIPQLEDKFLLLNGCSFFDFNLLDLAVQAENSRALAQVALKSERRDERHGRALREGPAAGHLPSAGTRPGGQINAGVSCIDRRILDLIGEAPCSLEHHVFPELIGREQLRATLYDGFFIDIGVPSDFDRAQTEMPAALRRPAVFFDRDGVLNVDKNYVHEIADFEWIAGAREAIKLCNDRGYLTFVVTNQAGVARGYYGIDAVHGLHDWMSGELAEVGAHIEEFQYCPFHEHGVVEAFRGVSDRRKPAPGMLLDCLKGWPVRSEGSLLVGDKLHDLEAAVAAGVVGHLFEGGDLASFLEPRLR